MNQCILFQPPGRPVAIMYPCSTELSVEEVGLKDVPAGLPFWIVDTSTIPEDRTFRDAWELDEDSLGEPTGFGGAE